MVAYQLAQPILDNRASFAARWPDATYDGDVGDTSHLSGSGDHTPYSSDVIFGKPMARGWIYAQDFGNGAFDLASFSRWLLLRLRSGAYPEVKYVITRIPANKGVAGGVYFGLFDRRYNWRTQLSSGHDTHIHISYMPGYEHSHSRLMEDYWLGTRPALAPDPTWKVWAKHPVLPKLPLGAFSTATFDQLPYTVYPPLALGYGGKGAPQAQTDWVWALQMYARGSAKTAILHPAEVAERRIGATTLAFCHMIADLAGNPWGTDPARNAKAFGAAIGAPAVWAKK